VELRQLHFVVLLSEELHFRRAAERAHIAQPAFSEQIRRLERELGAQLFDRTSHYVRLTEVGRLFLEEIRQALVQVDRAAAVAEQAGRGELGSIRVGFVGFAADELTPRILRAFAARHPRVEVTLHGFDFADTTAGLAGQDVDVAFVQPPVDGQDALALVTLISELRAVVMADDHRLAGANELAMADLAEERLVAGSSVDELLAIVAAGTGIALVPASSARFHARPGLRFVPVPDAAPATVAVAHRAGAPSPLVRAFVDVARAVAGECGDRVAVSRLTDLVLAEP
jgi:DNA-binding transcriptional LysR family regulator